MENWNDTASDLQNRDKKDNSASNLFQSAVDAAFYSLAKAPVNALAQLAGQEQVFQAPAPAQFGSARWVAQEIGSAAGSLPLVLALHAGAGKVLGGAAEAEVAALFGETASLNMKRSMLTGLALGAVFTPSEDKGNLVWNRLKNGLTTGAAFGAATGGIHWAGDMPTVKSSLLRQTAVGASSGALAGAVSAEVNSVLSGHGLATTEELGKGVLSMGLVGGTFGLMHGLETGNDRSLQVRNVSKRSIKAQSSPVENVDGRSGVSDFYFPDGSFYSKDAAGSLFQAADGTTIRYLDNNGSPYKVVDPADALPYTEYTESGTGRTVRQSFEQGEFTVVNHDGSSFTQDSPGPWRVQLADGALFEKASDGTLRETRHFRSDLTPDLRFNEARTNITAPDGQRTTVVEYLDETAGRRIRQTIGANGEQSWATVKPDGSVTQLRQSPRSF